MDSDLTTGLTIFVIAGAGLIAGLMFTFSNFAMRAFNQMSVSAGIEAMQRINVTIINPVFMFVFMGTPLAALYLAFIGLRDSGEPNSELLLAGSLLYVVGTFLVTVIFNVPRNNALAGLDANDSASAGYWAKYQREWLIWNHIRTLAAVGSVVLLGLSLT